MFVMLLGGCEYATPDDKPKDPVPALTAAPTALETNKQAALEKLGPVPSAPVLRFAGPVADAAQAVESSAVAAGTYLVTGSCTGTTGARILVSQDDGIHAGLPLNCGATARIRVHLSSGEARISLHSDATRRDAVAAAQLELLHDAPTPALSPEDWARGVLGKPGPFERLGATKLDGAAELPDSASNGTFDMSFACLGYREVQLTVRSRDSGRTLMIERTACRSIRGVRIVAKEGGILIRIEPLGSGGDGAFGYRIGPVPGHL
ncbi:hypothetical protein BIU82_08955 [Arthrobacter sp. SW1]|nr:hypothetical protein BIU82_08955 [Arthrobacter sp. SW1]